MIYGHSFKSVAWGGAGGRSNYCYEPVWMFRRRPLFGVMALVVLGAWLRDDVDGVYFFRFLFYD